MPRTVLLVEDDAAGVSLVRGALRACGIRAHLLVVADAWQAMDVLLRQGAWAGTPLPDLIVHDHALPRLGSERLRALAARSGRAQRIPVLVIGAMGNRARALGDHCGIARAARWEDVVGQFRALARSLFGQKGGGAPA